MPVLGSSAVTCASATARALCYLRVSCVVPWLASRLAVAASKAESYRPPSLCRAHWNTCTRSPEPPRKESDCPVTGEVTG